MITCRLAVILAERRIAGEEPFSGRALAMETSTHPDTIYRLVNNQSERISLDVLDKICCALDVQVGDILVYVPDEQVEDQPAGDG